jgi:hypothetical protein
MSFSTAAFALLCALALAVPGQAHAATPSMSIAIATDKPAYYPGEVVTLRVTLSPKAAEGVIRRPSVAASTLDVFVAFEKERFKAYLGPGWGLKDSLLPLVKATQSRPLVIETELFYQVRVTDLDEPRAAYHREGFVFQQLGTYRIKVVFHDAAGDIESPATTISVKPLDDAESSAIWREITNAPEFGYLVHTGVVPVPPGGGPRGGADGETTRRLPEQITSLVARYPRSPLVATLKRALVANRAARENSSHNIERVISRPDREPTGD